MNEIVLSLLDSDVIVQYLSAQRGSKTFPSSETPPLEFAIERNSQLSIIPQQNNSDVILYQVFSVRAASTKRYKKQKIVILQYRSENFG